MHFILFLFVLKSYAYYWYLNLSLLRLTRSLIWPKVKFLWSQWFKQFLRYSQQNRFLFWNFLIYMLTLNSGFINVKPGSPEIFTVWIRCPNLFLTENKMKKRRRKKWKQIINIIFRHESVRKQTVGGNPTPPLTSRKNSKKKNLDPFENIGLRIQRI